jgi:hypothetical protein
MNIYNSTNDSEISTINAHHTGGPDNRKLSGPGRRVSGLRVSGSIPVPIMGLAERKGSGIGSLSSRVSGSISDRSIYPERRGIHVHVYMTDFRLHKVYENGLKSVKDKCNN